MTYNYSTACKDTYNFKIGDSYLNNLLSAYYKEYYHKFMNDINMLNNISPEHINDFEKTMVNDFKYDLMEPAKVIEEHDKYILHFEIMGQSNIFGNENHSTNNTKFKLYEKKNISKNTHAYIVLYFPNYDNQGNKKNDYLLSTLLVAYSLKNHNNNYDLSKNNKKGTKAKIICMTTPDTDEMTKKILEIYYDEVKIVPFIAPHDCVLPDHIKNNKDKFIPIQDVSKSHLQKNHGYYKVFTKLNIFNKNLFPYEKVILLDSDLFPMGHFDTLFSIDTPAGCIEHKRLLLPDLGVSSWITDRNPFCKHGQFIPKILTDIENMYASDINASLLIITPNTDLYYNLITDLQKPINEWFGPDKNHKGFWLGNAFLNYYVLPEQNFLTKKFSGTWRSVDIGFSTWLIDLNTAFGFTFAGFVIKPWRTQSAFHYYTINPLSQFSKINNKLSQRAYGCQLLNNLLFNMIINIKNNYKCHYPFIKTELEKMSLIFQSFDPWEPEVQLEKCPNKTLNEITESDLINISYDQKRLVYLCNDIINKNKLKKIIYLDYIFDMLCRNIYNLHFTSISYQLVSIFYDMCTKLKLNNKLFPFGKSLISLHTLGSLDFIDDDNDFILIMKKQDFKPMVISLIYEIININCLQAYICLKNNNKFVKIIPDNMQINKGMKKDEYMLYSHFKNIFDFNNLKFFNISFTLPFIEQYMQENNVKMQQNMLLSVNGNNYPKIPWIDIFFAFEENNKLVHNTWDKIINFSKDTFNQTYYKNDFVTDKYFKIPNVTKYSFEHYNNHNLLSHYIVKSKKDAHLKIPYSSKVETAVLYSIKNFINSKIKTLYAIKMKK